MNEKKLTRGVRTSLEKFAQYCDIEVYPLYAISNLVKQYANDSLFTLT